MNLYFLLGGILAAIIGIVHAYWGEKNLAPELNGSDMSSFTKIAWYIPYHQITWVLLLSGLSLMGLGVFDTVEGVKNIGILIEAVTVGNFAVFLMIGASKDTSIITKSVPQLILFTALIILLTLGNLS